MSRTFALVMAVFLFGKREPDAETRREGSMYMICSILKFFICPDYALAITGQKMVNKSRQAGGLGGRPKGASDALARPHVNLGKSISDLLSLSIKFTCTNLCPAGKGHSGG
jgi:hypothetical protein